MAERYNGWTNYETWCVQLWMDNDERLQAHVGDLITRTIKAGLDTKDLANVYEEFVQDLAERDYKTGTFVADLVLSALSKVNWIEIAETLLADCVVEPIDRMGEVEE